jgi:hypothetical protein
MEITAGTVVVITADAVARTVAAARCVSETLSAFAMEVFLRAMVVVAAEVAATRTIAALAAEVTVVRTVATFAAELAVVRTVATFTAEVAVVRAVAAFATEIAFTPELAVPFLKPALAAEPISRAVPAAALLIKCHGVPLFSVIIRNR